MYTVRVKKTVIKQLRKCPEVIQILFNDLVEDLELKGPAQTEWPNYSALSKNTYHCHLKHSWVACWYYEKDSIEIEVYYAGSRESAPY